MNHPGKRSKFPQSDLAMAASASELMQYPVPIGYIAVPTAIENLHGVPFSLTGKDGKLVKIFFVPLWQNVSLDTTPPGDGSVVATASVSAHGAPADPQPVRRAEAEPHRAQPVAASKAGVHQHRVHMSPSAPPFENPVSSSSGLPGTDAPFEWGQECDEPSAKRRSSVRPGVQPSTEPHGVVGYPIEIGPATFVPVSGPIEEMFVDPRMFMDPRMHGGAQRSVPYPQAEYGVPHGAQYGGSYPTQAGYGVPHGAQYGGSHPQAGYSAPVSHEGYHPGWISSERDPFRGQRNAQSRRYPSGRTRHTRVTAHEKALDRAFPPPEFMESPSSVPPRTPTRLPAGIPHPPGAPMKPESAIPHTGGMTMPPQFYGATNPFASAQTHGTEDPFFSPRTPQRPEAIVVAQSPPKAPKKRYTKRPLPSPSK